MKKVATALVALVAIEHLYILVLEMFLWTRPAGLRAFGLTQEFAEQTAVLAANQGLYNGFLAAGLCPVGQVQTNPDTYANFDTRTIEGYDLGVYYSFETGIGDFDLRYNGAFYERLEQKASSEKALAILEAKETNSAISYPLVGIGDLLGINGNFEAKQSASIAWRKGDWAASVAGVRIGDFLEILDTDDNDPWEIPTMTTYNAKIDYQFDVGDVATRVRLGINNVTDERAPLADESFGFYKDVHRDWGRNYYLDVRMQF